MVNEIMHSNLNYIISGDSISKGVVYDEERDKYVVLKENYVAILQSKLKGLICNTAKFGNTIIKGTNKLQNDISKNNYDVALIEYGGNDCDFHWNEIAAAPELEHYPKTEYNVFGNTLREMINKTIKNNITPVLMTLPPLNADNYLKWVSQSIPSAETNILKWLGSVTKIYWWQERYNAAILKVAYETNTRIIDVREAFLKQPDFREYICVDGIHPNQKGHIIIAEKIIEFIESGYHYLLK